jgi:hypothetical protein
MAERALMCPQCNGPLSPGRFARSVVCSYCGATVTLDEASVEAARYRRAFADWDAPASHGLSSWLEVEKTRWAPGALVARGEISDVYAAIRARWPTERALAKVLRDAADQPLLDHEWAVLAEIRSRTPDSAAAMLARIPEPIAHGRVSAGAYAGRYVMVVHAASGFQHTLDDVRRAFPTGIPPQSSIWVWRRILEVLAFLHERDLAHGAVLPRHLLVETNEHGLRMVGFSAADRPGAPLRTMVEDASAFYPASRGPRTVSPRSDVAMSARCLAFLLGGDPATASVPASVPGALAALVRETATAGSAEGGGRLDAWPLREQLGTLAREVFGPPKFCPLVVPG